MFRDFQQGEGLYHKQMKAVNIVITMCIKLNTHIHLLSIDPHYIFRSISRIVWGKVISSQVFVCPRGKVGFPACITGHMTRGSAQPPGCRSPGCIPPWIQTPWMQTTPLHGTLRDTVNKRTIRILHSDSPICTNN